MNPVMSRPWFVLAAIVVGIAATTPAAGAPTQAPRFGGTVIFGGPFGEPACLTPFRGDCGWATSLTYAMVQGTALAAPFSLGPDLSWQPSLVSSDTLPRSAPFTLTYRIRPEARWSDGVPITARDFVFTHRASLKYIAAEAEDIDRTMVKSMSAVDAKTVRIVLRQRFSGW